ncbi:MAG: 4'-phosphopantetheinyl transferase superfamily protein [Anaerolineales bacterium]|nr:4'-phosphopantetheinyl transferase superfamily protein [Anaerolineales bacterium]
MISRCSWPSPAAQPELSAGEAHLWFADLRQPPEVVRALGGLLSPDERSRADRFFSEVDRSRYIVSHGLLRQLLGQYLALGAGDLAFRYGKWGKPSLHEWQNSLGLQFNLSHSSEGAVYGFVKGRRIGVDVELVRPIPEMDDLADRFFSPEDCHVYRSNSWDRREETFLRCWTRMEAIEKARGQGLVSPNRVGVGAASDARAPQTADRKHGRFSGAWMLQTFSPNHRFIGTLAIEAPSCKIEYFTAKPGDQDLTVNRSGCPG